MKRKLQLFVSSTFTDLQEERQAAVSAILNAGHIPAGMELFTSGDRSQLDVIKEWISESDVYLLILGGRYGSLEPESGLSYTEVEYDYAKEIGKPYFAVVASEAAIDQKLKDIGKAGLETNHGLKLEDFRKKVLSSMSRFFDEPKDIKLAIHETLQDFTRHRDLKGWVPADMVEDTKPLHDVITSLRAQIDLLSQELSNAQVRLAPASDSAKEDEKFEELERLLVETKIVVPEEIAQRGTEVKTNLFAFLMTNRDLWVRGVTSGESSTDRTKWLTKNVYPRYIVHKLMNAQPRPGGTFYALAGEGLDFLAWLDRREQRSKASKDA